MESIDILALCMIVSLVSFLGFIVENIWLAATKGFIDNRNMCFPFLIGYGIAIMLIFLIFGTPNNMWIFGNVIKCDTKYVRLILYFVCVSLCVSVGEILLGKFVEKTCKFRWWDYTKLPLHITQYTSVPTSATFGLLITAFMDKFFEKLFIAFKQWDYETLKLASGVLMAVMIGDFLYNAAKMYKNKRMPIRWRIDVKHLYLYRKIHSLNRGHV